MILLLCSSWYGKQLSRGISTLGLYFPSRRFIFSFTQDLSDHRFCNFCSKESRHYCRSNAIWINESITTSYALATRDVRKKYTSAALIGVQEKRSVYCLQTIKVRTSSSSSGSKPDWSKLQFHQCENCPLGTDVEYCPVAVNLANIVEGFKGRDSIEKALVTVEIKERKYQNRLDIQKGLGSLMGVVSLDLGG